MNIERRSDITHSAQEMAPVPWCSGPDAWELCASEIDNLGHVSHETKCCLIISLKTVFLIGT